MTTLKTISATTTRPERQTDGKYIAPTNSKMTVTDASELYLQDCYKAKAAATHSGVPKCFQTLTTSLSFCKHTNTKLVVGTSFHNSQILAKFISSEHPIFSKELPLLSAIEIYLDSKTPTEQYVSMVAVLVKSRLLDTSRCGLMLDTKAINYLSASFTELVAVLSQAARIDFKVHIAPLVITPDIESDAGRLKTHIKEAAAYIDSATYAAGGKRIVQEDAATTKALKLDEEIALERELNGILNNYSAPANSNKYTPELNGWTRRVLSRGELNTEQVTMMMRILNTSPDSLRTGTIEKVLPILETNLEYADDLSRRNSAIVLRHLKYKLELQLACMYKHGFIADIVAEEIRSDKTLTTYVAKTRIEEDAAIAKLSATSSSALARLRKQHGA
jgi:hypothetical protein